MGQISWSDRTNFPASFEVGAEGRTLWRREQMLEDLDQDIRDHIERETQDNIECGMLPEDARYAALRKFGNEMRIH